MPRKGSRDERRFTREWWAEWTMPEPNTGCHIWMGSVDQTGYGRAWKDGVSGILIHRIAYESAFGPFDASFKVCHRCDMPSCVNPDHIFLGTQKDNLRDMFSKGRARPRGWVPGEQAKRVLDAYAAQPYLTQRELAEVCGAAQGRVWKILKDAGIVTRRSPSRATLAARRLARANSNTSVGIAAGVHHMRDCAVASGWRHASVVAASAEDHDAEADETSQLSLLEPANRDGVGLGTVAAVAPNCASRPSAGGRQP